MENQLENYQLLIPELDYKQLLQLFGNMSQGLNEFNHDINVSICSSILERLKTDNLQEIKEIKLRYLVKTSTKNDTNIIEVADWINVYNDKISNYAYSINYSFRVIKIFKSKDYNYILLRNRIHEFICVKYL